VSRVRVGGAEGADDDIAAPPVFETLQPSYDDWYDTHPLRHTP
jgi:hypothetical protein